MKNDGKGGLTLVGVGAQDFPNWIPSHAKYVMSSAVDLNTLHELPNIVPKGKVVEGRNDYLDVAFPKNRMRIPARLTRISDRADASMIKIELPQSLKKVELNDNYDTIKVGDTAVCMGYPGVSPSVLGVVASTALGDRSTSVKELADPTLSVGNIARVIRSTAGLTEAPYSPATSTSSPSTRRGTVTAADPVRRSGQGDFDLHVRLERRWRGRYGLHSDPVRSRTDGGPARGEVTSAPAACRHNRDVEKASGRSEAIRTWVSKASCARGCMAGSLLNALIGEYRLVEPLGAGGMGEVYKAVHIHHGRVIAVKILFPEFADGPSIERFYSSEHPGGAWPAPGGGRLLRVLRVPGAAVHPDGVRRRRDSVVDGRAAGRAACGGSGGAGECARLQR